MNVSIKELKVYKGSLTLMKCTHKYKELDIRQKDTGHNDIQHNDIQHNKKHNIIIPSITTLSKTAITIC
jgi:hypothetical protein